MATDAQVCPDDYPSATLKLIDGTVIQAARERCTSDEPYKTLVPKMMEIRATVPVADAGGGG